MKKLWKEIKNTKPKIIVAWGIILIWLLLVITLMFVIMCSVLGFLITTIIWLILGGTLWAINTIMNN